MLLQPSQEFIQRGFFQETVAEESKVKIPVSLTEGGIDADMSSSSSEEVSKEQEEPSPDNLSLGNSY